MTPRKNMSIESVAHNHQGDSVKGSGTNKRLYSHVRRYTAPLKPVCNIAATVLWCRSSALTYSSMFVCLTRFVIFAKASYAS